jgi:hypothetical protein
MFVNRITKNISFILVIAYLYAYDLKVLRNTWIKEGHGAIRMLRLIFTFP